MSLVYLAVAIAFEICGTTALKLSFGLSRMAPTAVVAIAYPLSFAALALALRGIDLSVAYAVWSGVGTAVVALIGIFWFSEPAGVGKLVSLALIVAGVVGLHLFGRPA
jgi:small multidrug resistance pump